MYRPLGVRSSCRTRAETRHICSSRARKPISPCRAVLLRDEEVLKSLTTEYDPEQLENFFSKRRIVVVRRLFNVSLRFISFFLSRTLNSNSQSANANTLDSSDITILLSSLGPTFVKLGQTLSTREDLIGKELARSLSDLQMAAPPFPDAVAIAVITSELEAPPSALFQTFSEEHVAAASLGQVYRGTLPNGDDVAVKVQRPDLLGSIALDVYVLRVGLAVVRRLAGINSDLRKIADEVGRGLFAELDYRIEIEQAALFQEAHSHLPYIDTVQPLPQLSSKRVLTTKWLHGVSPTELLVRCEAQAESSPERTRIQQRLVGMVNLGVECSLSQLLETGVMHADPHPGNLIMTSNDRLAYLDFGLLTFVPPQSSQAMMGCLVHIALGRWRSVTDDLDGMGFLKDKIDRELLSEALAEEVTAVWPLAGSFGADSFLPDGSAQEGGLLAARLEEGTVRPELGLAQGLSFGLLAKVIIKLAIRFRFNLPAYYTLIVRSLCSLEGLALRVDPSFSIVNAAIPIILRRMLTDTRPKAVQLLRELLLEDGSRLRIGMLEGLLRNYSAEVGKDMTRNVSAGVVLKGLEVDAGAPENGAALLREGGAEPGAAVNGTRGRSMNGATQGGVELRQHVGAPAVAASTQRLEGDSGGEVPVGVTGLLHVVEEEQDMIAKGRHIAAHARTPTSLSATVVQDNVHRGEAEDEGSTEALREERSLEMQVITMVLSARAAGVRRVLLEADMKDVVQQVCGPSGKVLRERAASALAGLLTWSLIPRAVLLSFSLAFNAVIKSIRALFGRRRRCVGSLPGMNKGVTVKGVHLNAAAMKRVQLMMVVGFARLWRQSWTTAMFSMWIGIRIFCHAVTLRVRGISSTDAAA